MSPSRYGLDEEVRRCWRRRRGARNRVWKAADLSDDSWGSSYTSDVRTVQNGGSLLRVNCVIIRINCK